MDDKLAGVEQISKLQVYSVGIVANNKERNSFVIEVYPQETAPDNSGEIAAVQATVTAKAKDAKGAAYEASAKVGSTITARWLPLGEPNRMTAPDVRRGDMVILYRFGDSKDYFWVTITADMNFRKLETVVYGWSATAKEGEAPSLENIYYIEISTHKGLIHFHTTTANGEACGYDIQLNTKDGKFSLVDTFGNSILLDSVAQKFQVKNPSGSFMDLTKKVFKMQADDSVNIKTKEYTLDATTSTTNAETTNINANTNIKGETSMKGSLSQTGGSGAAFGGDVKAEGHIDLKGSMDIVGTIRTGKLISTQSIVAPNVD